MTLLLGISHLRRSASPLVFKHRPVIDQPTLRRVSFPTAQVVVEDVEDSREAVQLLLEQLGASVVVARDGVEALAAVDRQRPDVVLCDLRMPRMDGFELLREVRSTPLHANLPIIALSRFVSSADRQRSRAAGFDDHLGKPFDLMALSAVIGAVVARPGLNEPAGS